MPELISILQAQVGLNQFPPALTVDLSAASTQNVTVDYAITGTATGPGTDYSCQWNPNYKCGATSGTITIAGIVDDGLDEVNETVIVTLSIQ